MALDSVRAAEIGTRWMPEANAKLRLLYERKDIEFLGVMDIGSGATTGVGARWWDPETGTPRTHQGPVTKLDAEVSFTAARAFLGLGMKDVMLATGVTAYVLRTAERSRPVSADNFRKLITFYRSKRVLLLGRRDADMGFYVGVGVVSVDDDSEV